MSDFQEKMEQLFPDETVTVREYQSFVNQPERIQISSQQDTNDYDPRKLTTYFNFRVPLPRPALNVKSIQLARASIPNVVASFPDAETTFWFYALPYEGSGSLFANNGGVPGDIVATIRRDGLLLSPGGAPEPGQVFFDGSGTTPEDISGLLLINAQYYTYNSLLAMGGPPFTAQPVYSNAGALTYWIQFTERVIGLPRASYLRYIRLLPSWCPADLLDDGIISNWPVNRIYDDVPDLVTDLNVAAEVDPLFNTDLNDIPGTFKFIPNLVSFTYNDRFKKIVMRGAQISDENGPSIIFHYMPAPSDDPQWVSAAAELEERDTSIAGEGYIFDEFGVSSVVQPFTPYRNMNTRLGYTYPIFPTDSEDYNNMIRPHPGLDAVPRLNAPFEREDHLAPGYPDLVNTACVLIYTDITGGSTLDSVANKALLASVPMNTPNLGVGFHSLPLNNPLTKIANQINEIYIEMRTDSGEPFYIGNNAIVSMEFILTY